MPGRRGIFEESDMSAKSYAFGGSDLPEGNDAFSESDMSRTALRFLGFALFCALFGGIYERFSHGVYSYYMIYAFAIPLLLIVLPVMISLYFKKSRKQTGHGFQLWSFGVVTLTIGCLFKGVLDIYGTTNRLIVVYPAAGGLLMTAGLILFFKGRGERRRHAAEAGMQRTAGLKGK